jgi:hypothetical protein
MAKLFHARSEIKRSGIHKIIDYIFSKEKLPYQWKEYYFASLEEGQ